MGYPVTDRLLDKLTTRQHVHYKRAMDKRRDDLPVRAWDRVQHARRFYRNITKPEPEYLTRIKITDEDDDGSTYTVCVIVVPRDERLNEPREDDDAVSV